MKAVLRHMALSFTLVLAGGATAHAGGTGGGAHPPLTQGGPAHFGLFEQDGVQIGVGQLSPAALSAAAINHSGMKLGGYVRWNQGQTGLDATVSSLPAGENRFSLNPARAGISDPGASGGTAMTVTLNHAITPSLSLVGTAEATRPASPLPGSSGRSLSLGAGLGVRF